MTFHPPENPARSPRSDVLWDIVSTCCSNGDGTSRRRHMSRSIRTSVVIPTYKCTAVGHRPGRHVRTRTSEAPRRKFRNAPMPRISAPRTLEDPAHGALLTVPKFLASQAFLPTSDLLDAESLEHKRHFTFDILVPGPGLLPASSPRRLAMRFRPAACASYPRLRTQQRPQLLERARGHGQVHGEDGERA